MGISTSDFEIYYGLVVSILTYTKLFFNEFDYLGVNSLFINACFTIDSEDLVTSDSLTNSYTFSLN